jgi:hypothetical protein
MPTNILARFFLSRIVADRKIPDAATANRVALTGALIGGESPILSLVMTDQLAEREKPAEPRPPEPPSTIPVPDVQEKPLTEAMKLLSDFVVETQPVVLVKEQDPVANTLAARGSTVKLKLNQAEISRGRGPG